MDRRRFLTVAVPAFVTGTAGCTERHDGSPGLRIQTLELENLSDAAVVFDVAIRDRAGSVAVQTEREVPAGSAVAIERPANGETT